MEFRQLQQIAAVCRHGGFSGAARNLRISQPTLSKSIARMEDKLGVQLFDREGGAARPTIYGEFLAARAGVLVRNLEALEQEFHQFKQGGMGQLRIGFGPAPREMLLSQLVAQIGDGFPNLRVRTEIAHADQVSRAVLEGEYDVGFVSSEGAQRFGDLIRAKVFADRYVATVRPGHPALIDVPLGPAELLRYKIAACAIVPCFRRWLGPVGQDAAENLRGLVTDVYDLIGARAATSDFVAVAPKFIFKKRLDAGELVELPLTWEGRYECWMVARPDTWQSPVLRQVLSYAREIATSHEGKPHEPTLRVTHRPDYRAEEDAFVYDVHRTIAAE